MTLEELPDRNHLPELLNSMGCIGTGVEVGVFKGQYSYELLSRWPGTLIGVDSYNNGTDFHLLLNAIHRNRDAITEGRYRIIVHRSPHAAYLVPDELDFVFLDGDHSHEGIASDIAAWWPKIKRGGLLGGHDFEEASSPVADAVLGFAILHELKVYPKRWGSWFIMKP